MTLRRIWQLTCDRCGRTRTFWPNQSRHSSIDAARSAGWDIGRDNAGHRCPECVEMKA